MRSRLTATEGRFEPRRHDVIVFAKAFRDSDVAHAQAAVRAGVPVVLDVCDNIFVQGYSAHSALNVRRLAELATSIVTTGTVLAEVLKCELGSAIDVRVVPDPAEDRRDARMAARLVRRELFSDVVREPHPYVRRLRIPRLPVRRRRRGDRRAEARNDDSRDRSVIWFGNVGSVVPRFGIVNLADIAPELAVAFHETPFRLRVVTGDYAAYMRHIAPLGLDTTFANWSRLGIFRELRRSAVALIPNSRDEFSVCKSANRAVLALSQGVPVVATSTPALEPFAECVLFDDFAAGVTRYLNDHALASEHVRHAQSIIARDYAPGVIANRWLSIFRTVLPGVKTLSEASAASPS